MFPNSAAIYPFPVVSRGRSQEVVCPSQGAAAYLPHYLKGLMGLIPQVSEVLPYDVSYASLNMGVVVLPSLP